MHMAFTFLYTKDQLLALWSLCEVLQLQLCILTGNNNFFPYKASNSTRFH